MTTNLDDVDLRNLKSTKVIDYEALFWCGVMREFYETQNIKGFGMTQPKSFIEKELIKCFGYSEKEFDRILKENDGIMNMSFNEVKIVIQKAKEELERYLCTCGHMT